MVCFYYGKDCEVYRDSCARLPVVARGLHVLSSPAGTPVIGGAVSPGFICSKMFGVSIEKYIIYVRWFATPMQA